MKVVVAPYSQRLRNGKQNPKEPSLEYWTQVASLLKDCHLVQIALDGDTHIVPDVRVRLTISEIANLIKESDTWLSVDSFLPHLAYHLNKPGVVVFSQSDPNIYGYAGNTNLLKGRSYLRQDQFGLWENASYNSEAFVAPDVVANAVMERLRWNLS